MTTTEERAEKFRGGFAILLSKQWAKMLSRGCVSDNLGFVSIWVSEYAVLKMRHSVVNYNNIKKLANRCRVRREAGETFILLKSALQLI